jgi:hypothetical protein
MHDPLGYEYILLGLILKWKENSELVNKLQSKNPFRQAGSIKQNRTEVEEKSLSEENKAFITLVRLKRGAMRGMSP